MEELTAKGAPRASLDTPNGEIPDRALHASMDGLFAETLSACIKDACQASPAQHSRVPSSLGRDPGRVAGFLAGHRDLREDPMRMAASALLSGYDVADDEQCRKPGIFRYGDMITVLGKLIQVC